MIAHIARDQEAVAQARAAVARVTGALGLAVALCGRRSGELQRERESVKLEVNERWPRLSEDQRLELITRIGQIDSEQGSVNAHRTTLLEMLRQHQQHSDAASELAGDLVGMVKALEAILDREESSQARH